MSEVWAGCPNLGHSTLMMQNKATNQPDESVISTGIVSIIDA